MKKTNAGSSDDNEPCQLRARLPAKSAAQPTHLGGLTLAPGGDLAISHPEREEAKPKRGQTDVPEGNV